MKKRLRFFSRSITTDRRWQRWINSQTLLILVISTVFLITLFQTATYSAQDTAPTPTPAGLSATADSAQGGTPTPLPAEFYYNSEQTIGITLAATLLVLIVVAGTILFLPHKPKA